MSRIESDLPVLLLRAQPDPVARETFARWFRDVHIVDVRRIPGIDRVLTGLTPGGVHLALYTFDGSTAMEAALGSPEAAYARGTWERWAPVLLDLTVEMLAPLSPLSLYESRS